MILIIEGGDNDNRGRILLRAIEGRDTERKIKGKTKAMMMIKAIMMIKGRDNDNGGT